MPRHISPEKTKPKILEVAIRLFNERGWNSVSIEEIVKEANLTRGAFYHYFKSREELVHVAMTEVLAHVEASSLALINEEDNALKRINLSLKFFLESTLNIVQTGGLFETIYDPLVVKSNILFLLEDLAPAVEKRLIEGNEDGSISTLYPKHTAQAMVLVLDKWINHTIFRMSEHEFSERLLFLEHFCKQLGVPVVDDEIKELFTRIYEYCKQK